MILRAPKRLKPRPGQWIVATNGEGARVLLVTRVLPNRVFFREQRAGGAVENFVAPDEVLLSCNSPSAAEGMTRTINKWFDDRNSAIKAANAALTKALRSAGIVTE